MSNITEQIEKLAEDYADNHAFRVPFDGTNNFYDDKDFKWSKEGFIAGYKAALQNNECYFTPNKISTSATICANCGKEKFLHTIGQGIKATKAIYQSDERNENIPADFKQVTGHDSPKEMKAYEKGREDEQQVIMKWIEQWDGSSNSVMGALLNKKFDERKDNAGVNDAIEFADWINKNASRNAVGSWGYFGNMFYTKTSKELYDIFKSESQPQQKEVDEYEDEMPPL